MRDEPCPYCDTWEYDDHEPGECLVGLDPSPGDDRRAYLRRLCNGYGAGAVCPDSAPD